MSLRKKTEDRRSPPPKPRAWHSSEGTRGQGSSVRPPGLSDPPPLPSSPLLVVVEVETQTCFHSSPHTPACQSHPKGRAPEPKKFSGEGTPLTRPHRPGAERPLSRRSGDPGGGGRPLKIFPPLVLSLSGEPFRGMSRRKKTEDGRSPPAVPRAWRSSKGSRGVRAMPPGVTPLPFE